MDYVVQSWLQSGQYANLAGIDFLPRPHPIMHDSPLVTVRGQAAAYHLRDINDQLWILKKFLPGRSPDAHYVNAISALVPKKPGFESGHERHVLTSSSVSNQGYSRKELAVWIEGTILMRVVDVRDWAGLADDLREGRESLAADQRLLLCQRLCEQVRLLEAADVSHRDLSSTNVFVDSQNLEIHFIDWDSLYHSTLSMPDNTTFGTPGYIAPFIKVNGREDAKISWAPYADRFSMAILSAEFLSLDVGSPLTGDGGTFDQDELYNGGGPKTGAILDRVKVNCPGAVALIEMALGATSFADCPDPDEWIMAMVGKAGRKAMKATPGIRQSFVEFNYDALVTLNKAAFVRLNR
jgi:serine/threonine protein kinase